MSFTHCATCGHEFTQQGNDNPYADGGFMEVNHGGGQCRPCFIKSGHPECPVCSKLNFSTSKFCSHCGAALAETEVKP